MPTINSREIEVFKPYDSEYPEALLFAQGGDEATVDAFRDEEIVRVAKRGEEVLGLYVMRSKDNQGQRPEIYELLCVIVEPAVRKQGLGRWLIGHAIGVAESKGGRHMRIEQPGTSRCFQGVGFVRTGNGRALQFDMIQE